MSTFIRWFIVVCFLFSPAWAFGESPQSGGPSAKVNIWIRGGTIVDPARNIFGPGDVMVRGDSIVSVTGKPEAALVIDAGGCLVMPGLIDFHAHMYPGGSELGVMPDLAFLPLGVTTAVDAGSAGIANYEGFVNSIVAASRVRILSFINVSPGGLPTIRYHEEVNPKYFDLAMTKALLQKYKGQLLGLKVRQSRDIVGNLGLEPLRATLKMAENLGCPIAVHTTDPPSSMEDIAALLRKGDIFAHVFHAIGNTIISPEGKVLPGIREARKRGVIFDAANGRSHFSFKISRAALADGFQPDIISTDMTKNQLYQPVNDVFGLPLLMCKYLHLGMSLPDVVAACTSTPARLLGLEGKIGTLAPGAVGDVAIFRLVQKKVHFVDRQGQKETGDRLLIPQLTLREGRVAYRQIDF
jgi:dihydroorotase